MSNWHWLEDEEYYKRFGDISKKQYDIDCARGSSALAIKGLNFCIDNIDMLDRQLLTRYEVWDYILNCMSLVNRRLLMDSRGWLYPLFCCTNRDVLFRIHNIGCDSCPTVFGGAHYVPLWGDEYGGALYFKYIDATKDYLSNCGNGYCLRPDNDIITTPMLNMERKEDIIRYCMQLIGVFETGEFVAID